MNSPTRPSGDDPADEWVRQIQAGIDAERNFRRLFDQFYGRVFRLLLERGVDQTLCKDLTQETFIRAFNKIKGFKHQAKFSTWLFEIAHNVHNNEVRDRRAKKRDGWELPLQEESDSDEDERTAPALISPEPNPQEQMESREQSAALRQAVDTLPAQMRRCVLMRLYQGLMYREIAAILGISIDAVKAHLGQAKARLRRLLRAEELDRLDDPEDSGSE